TDQYGFHFKAYDTNIFTPVIRQEVREQVVKNKGHYTVYLPAYDDKRILKVLRKCKDIQWQVFSKHNKKPYKEKNIFIEPISNEAFIKSMATSAGVLCGAGFETPAEALFMEKKLLVIPMKGQYEQHCNAAALKEMGVPILKSLKLKHIDKIKSWIKEAVIIPVDYPDNTAEIINKIIAEHNPAPPNINETLQAGKKVYTAKKFRTMVLKSIATHL
ncbi:MAG: glycosyltransferase family protein, partial [Ferruginibacter sp.]